MRLRRAARWAFVLCMGAFFSGELAVSGASTVFPFAESALAQTKKKKSSQEAEFPAPSTSAHLADPDLDELAMNENAINSLQPGKFSIGLQFPNGGAITGTQAMGLRYLVSQHFGLTPTLQLGTDRAERKSALGLTLRIQEFFVPAARSVPYGFAQISVGRNFGEGFAGQTETQAGIAFGLGVEIFLIRELSTSVDVGLGYNFLPSRRATLTTATSQAALHYHFGF